MLLWMKTEKTLSLTIEACVYWQSPRDRPISYITKDIKDRVCMPYIKTTFRSTTLKPIPMTCWLSTKRIKGRDRGQDDLLYSSVDPLQHRQRWNREDGQAFWTQNFPVATEAKQLTLDQNVPRDRQPISIGQEEGSPVAIGHVSRFSIPLSERRTEIERQLCTIPSKKLLLDCRSPAMRKCNR